MPRAFDRRRQSTNDHDPMSNLLDYESVLDTTANNVGGPIRGVFDQLLGAFGLGGVADWLGGLPQTPEDIWTNVTNIFIAPLNFFATLVGGLIPHLQIPVLDKTKINGLTGLFDNVQEGFGSVFAGWFGTASTATTVDEALDELVTVAPAIRASVAGGFTLQTFTASDPTWTVPPELASAAEVYAGAFGGGGRGGNGQAVTGGGDANGGAGSSSGGYTLEKIDPSTLASTLAIVVGAGASTAGADGAVSSITSGATVLVASQTDRGLIADPRGYIPSLSLPGGGGPGGFVGTGDELDGVSGDPCGSAAGGAGGARAFSGAGSATASAGSAGAAGQTTNTPMSGGSGGGGGGAVRITGATGHAQGGNGGAGGYPGGGSGGGGGATAANLGTSGAGSAGAAANGMDFLLWR